MEKSDGNTLLLTAHPTRVPQSVRVEKEETGTLRAILRKKVYSTDQDVVYAQEWKSRYYGVNSTVDTTVSR